MRSHRGCVRSPEVSQQSDPRVHWGRGRAGTGVSIDRTPPAGLLSAHTRGCRTAAREGRMEAGMDWQKEIDELRRREELAEELGGVERVRRQHDGGRYTIRERIAKLVDPATFHELGKIAGRAVYDEKNDLTRFTPSNFVFGRATVDGRPVVVGGDDFTVRGGSADATIKGKHNMCERMAHDLRLPLIPLVAGSGGGGSVKTIESTACAKAPAIAGLALVCADTAK